MHLLWLDVKSAKGRKEGNDEEINREAIRPFGQGEKEVKSQSVRTRCSFEELLEWEQAKEERKKESKRTYTVRKRAVSEKRVFLHSNCISKCCNLYLIYWNYSEFVPWFFPSRRKSYHINFCVFVWCVSVVLAEIYSQLYKIFPNNLVTSGIKVWWLDLGL